jgi:hypothetical protein
MLIVFLKFLKTDNVVKDERLLLFFYESAAVKLATQITITALSGQSASNINTKECVLMKERYNS